MSTTDDGDFTIERCKETYNAHLANELGNLASRTSKLCDGLELTAPISPKYSKNVGSLIDAFQLKDAFDVIWTRVAELNKTLTDKKPWELEVVEKTKMMSEIRNALLQVAYDLQPFMPSTAELLVKHLSQSQLKQSPLFQSSPYDHRYARHYNLDPCFPTWKTYWECTKMV
jgi:methionyl-tRNA synthetase